MFQMFNAMFNALSTFFRGLEYYSSAFAKTGEFTEKRVENWVVDQTQELDRKRQVEQLPK